MQRGHKGAQECPTCPFVRFAPRGGAPLSGWKGDPFLASQQLSKSCSQSSQFGQMHSGHQISQEVKLDINLDTGPPPDSESFIYSLDEWLIRA